jgi:polysaccharide pyruvyl transferase WcaK-like protein
MKILLKGYYGFGNLGDDILLKVTYTNLRRRFSCQEIDVFSNYNENLNGFEKPLGYNHYIFKILGDRPSLIDWTHQRQYDYLIDGGGGIYFGQTKGKWYYFVLNYFVRLLGVSRIYLIDSWLRRIIGRPRRIKFNNRVGIGLGIGEYHKGFAHLFSQFSDIGSYNQLLVRDPESEKLLRQYGYRGTCGVFADLAFLTEDWRPIITRQPVSKSIAIVLLDFKRDIDNMFQSILNFEEAAIKRGYTVNYFSIDDVMDKGYRERFRTKTLFNWKPNEITLSDYLNLIAQNSIVISARAHGAILGACLGLVPVIIPHSQKLVQVSKMFPNASAIYPICSDGPLLNTIEYISLNLESCKSAVDLDIAINRKKAQQMMQNFLSLV